MNVKTSLSIPTVLFILITGNCITNCTLDGTVLKPSATIETHISTYTQSITMQASPTVESIRADIQTDIDFPRDMDLWDYDLMLDFINAADLVTLPEIEDILSGNQMMTRAEKEQLIEIADRRTDAILEGVE